MRSVDLTSPRGPAEVTYTYDLSGRPAPGITPAPLAVTVTAGEAVTVTTADVAELVGIFLSIHAPVTGFTATLALEFREPVFSYSKVTPARRWSPARGESGALSVAAPILLALEAVDREAADELRPRLAAIVGRAGIREVRFVVTPGGPESPG